MQFLLQLPLCSKDTESELDNHRLAPVAHISQKQKLYIFMQATDPIWRISLKTYDAGEAVSALSAFTKTSVLFTELTPSFLLMARALSQYAASKIPDCVSLSLAGKLRVQELINKLALNPWSLIAGEFRTSAEVGDNFLSTRVNITDRTCDVVFDLSSWV